MDISRDNLSRGKDAANEERPCQQGCPVSLTNSQFLSQRTQMY